MVSLGGARETGAELAERREAVAAAVESAS